MMNSTPSTLQNFIYEIYARKTLSRSEDQFFSVIVDSIQNFDDDFSCERKMKSNERENATAFNCFVERIHKKAVKRASINSEYSGSQKYVALLKATAESENSANVLYNLRRNPIRCSLFRHNLCTKIQTQQW